MNIKSSMLMNLKKRIFITRKVRIGKRFHLGMFSFISASKSLEIGNDVYIGKFCSIQCNGCIGDGALIGNNVGIVGRRDHDMRAVGVPIRLAPWVGDASYLADDPRNAVSIGADVWLGFGSIVLSGVNIGRGAIVAAGSVVINDVESYDIVSGNPARQIGRRFTDEQIVKHEADLCLRQV